MKRSTKSGQKNTKTNGRRPEVPSSDEPEYPDGCYLCDGPAGTLHHTSYIPERVILVCSEEQLAQLDDEALVDEAIQLRKDVNITMAEARKQRWEPKTDEGAREIPTDFDVRVEMVLDEFFEEYDQWPKSKATLNRRLTSSRDFRRGRRSIEDEFGGHLYPSACSCFSVSVTVPTLPISGSIVR